MLRLIVRNWLVPQCIWRYRRGVVITGLDCSYIDVSKALFSSQTSVLICQSTRRSITSDLNVQQHCCKTRHQHAFCRSTPPRRPTSALNMPFFSMFLPSSCLAFHSVITYFTRLHAELVSAGSYVGQDNTIINIQVCMYKIQVPLCH
jgi:hypothetical protein